MTRFLRETLAVLNKDLRVEARTRETLVSMLVFAVLVGLIFTFAVFTDRQTIRKIAPGIFWVAITFAGTLGLARSFARERESGGLRGLLVTPAGRGALFTGKMLSNAIFMGVVELILLPLFTILFDLPLWEVAGPLAGVLALGTIGFAAVGTLFAAMLENARLREVLLPVIFYPIVVPVVIAGVKATSGLLGSAELGEAARLAADAGGAVLERSAAAARAEVWGWLQILIIYDAIFLAVSTWIFEHLVTE
jgi:heme exporter protein B